MATAVGSEAAAAGSLTAAQILANARAMAPAITARSLEVEALRRLPSDLVDELRAAGFFRMGRSRAKGGPQMTLVEHLEVIEVLAHADPSVGWCVKIGTDSGLLAELLPPEASTRLLPHADMITAGQFTTAHGTLERVDGGYRLNGRFPFGSGVTHADVVMSGGALIENGAPVIGAGGIPEAGSRSASPTSLGSRTPGTPTVCAAAVRATIAPKTSSSPRTRRFASRTRCSPAASRSTRAASTG
jgi:alkylation response protein AidB-like acyl-CoA dehydrogenase